MIQCKQGIMISEEIREKRLDNGAKTYKQPKLFLNFGEIYFCKTILKCKTHWSSIDQFPTLHRRLPHCCCRHHHSKCAHLGEGDFHSLSIYRHWCTADWPCCMSSGQWCSQSCIHTISSSCLGAGCWSIQWTSIVLLRTFYPHPFGDGIGGLGRKGRCHTAAW